jgi:phosphopantothenoylcysteine decarboxylase / phosphopantothenate---cysteine ligase
VSDYRPSASAERKIHRDGKKNLSIELIPNNDILAGLGANKNKQLLVGFALEDTVNVPRAVAKLKRKNCDILILNSIGDALGTDQSEVHYITTEGKIGTAGPADKECIASEILAMLTQRLRGRK